ncbi:SAM-dependent methyltransferase [Anaerotaenia torta]|uniref:class I SAM-dependent methyltransferase n=1 Tax=Anaerotaenia torta TaxID=433293 RepID=UPI003D1C8BFB
MDSIEYYDENAASYFEETVDIDMRECQELFTVRLPEGASILDLGCGSGRDSAYFISCGYDVTAMDGSEEMCDLASIHIGQDALHLSFAEMDFDKVFDGIWACASLVHVPGDEIEEILAKVVNSLKIEGVLFMSFHHGDYEGEREGRYFKDYRVRTLKELIGKFENLEIIDIDLCPDTRIDKAGDWVYALVRRVELP